MRVLSTKEEALIKLAIFEANELLMDQIYRDFSVTSKKLTATQKYKLQEVFEVLYTVLCDTVENYGSLQSEYDR